MKKTFKLENLDCANCAAKMEKAIGKLDGVNSCSISFMSQKMSIDAEDEMFDDILSAAQKEIKKVDRACKIVK
ncbi:MAG: heavy metal-associated domain-containing protein [Eubacteriaceae bacterium]|nr:heavy metal-associated domain-containing protein [Eubacteriaceae bacterium]